MRLFFEITVSLFLYFLKTHGIAPLDWLSEWSVLMLWSPLPELIAYFFEVLILFLLASHREIHICHRVCILG